MSIRPAQERNALMERGSPVPNPSHEWDESTSTIASSDMSMDMSLDTSVMDMTEAWHPVDDAESSTTVDRESSMLAEEDSYTRDMEMTQAMAPVSTEQDTTTTMEFTSVHSALPGEDDLSMNTTMDSEAEQSAMEMTEMWGRIADEAQRRDAAAEEEVEALVGQESPRITASPSKPSQRSPERRQTMVLSPERSGRSVASSRTSTPKAPIAITPRPSTPPPAATDEAVALAPASPFSPVKAGPTTPTRFRQSLRGGVPSPEYQHSPARRALTTPPVGTVKPFATARAATPSSQTRAAHARLSEAHTPMYPRSPFIHSLIRQRGVRLSSTAPASPHVDTDDVSLSETSFHMHLADFLGVIGLKFHEDMTASRTKADRPLEPTPATTPVEHAKMAGAAVPMLQALRSACADLKQHVEDGRKRLKTMEENFYVRPPAFVQEWGQLDDEDMRRSMKGQLNVHKQAARAAAMHDYYGWRTDMEFDEEMTALLQKHRDLLQADRATLEAKEAQLTKTLLPALRARYADLHARVQEAWKRQEAIRQCDPEELKQLHASIDEQDQVLQTMRAKQHDLQDQLSRVQARVEETAAKREQTEEMIRAARAVTDQIQGCTPGEAVRLERHVRHLETLMQWSLTNKTSTLLQLTFARTWQVTIELDSRRGAVKRVAIAPATPIDVSHPHAVALAVIRAAMEAHTPTHVSDVLRAVARHWHAYQHICAEIAHVQTWVPVTMMPHQDQETALDILASVLLEKAQAKVQVRMVMDLAADDPLAARGLHMELVYGHVEYV
ncbi:mitotic spindle assembly checkpoint signaling protein [Malassezia pachydermatis]